MFNEHPWELQPRRNADPGADDLAFIRRTLIRASTFTAVPGRGLMAIGTIGLFAAWMASRQVSPLEWVLVWLAGAMVACPVGLVSMHRKALRQGNLIWSGPGLRFVVGMVPAFVAAGVLTATFVVQDLGPLIPGTWLLLYGAGVFAAGIRSVRVVPVMGGSLMLLGTLALLWPTLSFWFMGVGFGLLHIGFGALVAWRHGG